MRYFSLEEVLDSGTLSKELISGLLDGGLADLIVQVKTHDRSVLTWSGGAREGEHDALWHIVELAVGLKGDGLPFGGAEYPVAHVVD